MRERKLNKFTDSRGWSLMDIYEVAKEITRIEGETTSPNWLRDGDFQINYSLLHPGVVKAWHRHKNQDDYFCILHGMAQVGVYSEENGPEKHFIGEHNPAVVHIKAGEWHGLTCVGDEPCGLLYLVTKKYNPTEPDEERAKWDDFVGPDWWDPEYK